MCANCVRILKEIEIFINHLLTLVIKCYYLLLLESQEALILLGKSIKLIFIKILLGLSFISGVKIILWGKNWGRMWGTE